MEWVCDIDDKGMLCSRFKLDSDARVTVFHSYQDLTNCKGSKFVESVSMSSCK